MNALKFFFLFFKDGIKSGEGGQQPQTQETKYRVRARHSATPLGGARAITIKKQKNLFSFFCFFVRHHHRIFVSGSVFFFLFFEDYWNPM
jgi:hypothetical protein